MSARFRSRTAKVLRRNRTTLGSTLIPFAIGLLCVLGAFVTGEGVVSFPIIPLSIISGIAFALTYGSNSDPVPTEGEVSADAAGVRVGERLVVARDGISGGLVLPGSPVRVCIQRRLLPDVLVDVASLDEGRDLMRSLGLDATQTVAELRAASGAQTWTTSEAVVYSILPAFGMIAMIYVAALARSSFTAITGLCVVPLVMAYLVCIALAKTVVRIGVDGVSTRWLGKARFFPFAETTAVTTRTFERGGKYLVGVELAFKDGSKTMIPCGQEGWPTLDPSALEERIRAAWAAHARPGVEAPELLARGSKPLLDWIAHLRSVGSGAAASFRAAAVDPTRLLEIAEDVTAPAATRVAAAIAAVPELGTEARARIRIAAEATASPPLRTALERIADERGDDEAIGEALAELEAADPLSRGASTP